VFTSNWDALIRLYFYDEFSTEKLSELLVSKETTADFQYRRGYSQMNRNTQATALFLSLLLSLLSILPQMLLSEVLL